MIRVPRARLRAIVPSLLCLTLAACGGSGAVSSQDASGTLRVAVMLNATGPALNGSQRTPDVLRAWAKTVNSSGGVAGHRVEFVVKDLKANPSIAAATARQGAADKSISAVVMLDPFTEAIYAKTLTKAGLPVIGGLGVSPTIWGKEPNWLSLTTTFPSVINAPFNAAKGLGATRPATVVCAEYPTCAAITPIAQNAARKLGMAYGGTVKISLSAPDYTAQCLELKRRGVDFALLTVDATNAMRFISACKQQGYSGNWGFTGAIEPDVMVRDDPGVPISVTLIAFPWWVDDEPVKAYRKTMADQGVPEQAWANPNSTAAYATMELFKSTLTAQRATLSAKPTRADIVKAYGGAAQAGNLGGLVSQPIRFTPGRPAPQVTCYWLGTFKDRAFSGAELGRPTCDPPVLTQG